MTVRINTQGATTLATRIAGEEVAHLHLWFLLISGACVIENGFLLALLMAFLRKMFGILHNCLSQHTTREDCAQVLFKFNSSLHPYTTLVETFPWLLDFLTSWVKHRCLDSQTACKHDGELQKQKMMAGTVGSVINHRKNTGTFPFMSCSSIR